MLLDLLSTSNNICFNSKIASIVGLKPAIYISEVLNIYDKATRKNVLAENKYCTLDRSYIERRTTLSKDEQIESEKVLSALNILEKNEDGSVYLNVKSIIALMSANEEIVSAVEKKSKATRKTRRQSQFDALKSYIICDNEELKSAYYDWIDAVGANPKGFLSKRSIEIFQKNIDDFSNHNLDVALKLIEIAIVGGFRDASWAIESYRRQFGVSYRLPESSQITSKDQLSEVIF
jgi:hypothetical protein